MAALITCMAEYEVAGTHTMISLEGAYLSIYVHTYILYAYLSGRQVSIILNQEGVKREEALGRGRAGD